MTVSSNDRPKVLKNNRGQRFRLIDAGTFEMGERGGSFESSKPRDVVLSKPFYLAETQVTRGNWHAVMGTTPWVDDDPDPSKWDHPITHVSYHDAVDYCNRESQAGTVIYRLPTEAEWEYACKAGTLTNYSFGDDVQQLGDYAWFLSNSGEQTQPVGQKKPNPWGLYDMHGLVTEWCSDDWRWDVVGELIDPLIRNCDLRKVVRGGSWASENYLCLSHMRYGMHGEWRPPHVGFRLVLEPPRKSQKPTQPTTQASGKKLRRRSLLK